MDTPSSVDQQCPNLDTSPQTGILYGTNILSSAALAATPQPDGVPNAATPWTPPVVVINRGGYQEWLSMLGNPAVLIERRSQCKNPNALCSYHGDPLTGIILVNRITTTKTVIYNPPGYDPITSTPISTATPTATPTYTPTGNLVSDTTIERDGGTVRTQKWDTGYVITTLITLEYTDAPLASDGTFIESDPYVTTDLSGATTSIITSTLYETVEGLTFYYPCLRYEYNDMDDTSTDTHGRTFDFYGNYLNWRKE